MRVHTCIAEVRMSSETTEYSHLHLCAFLVPKEPNHTVRLHYAMIPMLEPTRNLESMPNPRSCHKSIVRSEMEPIPKSSPIPMYCHSWSWSNSHWWHKDGNPCSREVSTYIHNRNLQPTDRKGQVHCKTFEKIFVNRCEHSPLISVRSTM